MTGQWLAAGGGCLLTATVAAAQPAPAPSHRPEIVVNVLWTGGAGYGSSSANLTTPAGSPQPLYSTASRLAAGAGAEVQLDFRVTAHLRAQASGTWSRADLVTEVRADFEGVAPLTATLPVSLFTVEGSAVWSFHPRGRLEPFARAGAGWLRERTSDGGLRADGLVVNAGGGVKYWWRRQPRGLLKRFGLESEVRLAVRSGALTLGTRTMLAAPAVTVGAMVGF
jgi:hypothetical protein